MGKLIVCQSTIDYLMSSNQPNKLNVLMSGDWDKCEMDTGIIYYKQNKT